MTTRHVVGFAFMTLCLSVALARAQDTTATLLGTVTDSSGAVLPGVTVTVKNVDTSQARTGVETIKEFRVITNARCQARRHHAGANGRLGRARPLSSVASAARPL